MAVTFKDGVILGQLLYPFSIPPACADAAVCPLQEPILAQRPAHT